MIVPMLFPRFGPEACPSRRGRLTWLFFLCCAWSSAAALAQDRESVVADLLFYGDNTEFANPFREGETVLGAMARVVLSVKVNEQVSVEGGAFGNQRFGAERSFEQVRPVLSLVVHGPRHRFVFGTLREPVTLAFGPDRQNRHELLPAVQSETLSFTRPWEAGLQWMTTTPRLSQESWISWQQLNTAQHRERFDTGIVGSLRVGDRSWFAYQGHLVHRGGQLFAAGPVSDSYAAALGGRVKREPWALEEFSFEAWGLVSRDVPDREASGRSRTGRAFLVRTEAVRSGWRAHVLVFRGDDFVKAEGDPNYMSVRRDGGPFTSVRDYAEAGVARRFVLAPAVAMEASLRLHRVESHYEYSYRILGKARLEWPLP